MFYSEHKDGAGILIVQCESANDSVELLDSVRYIIQRETRQASEEQVNHTVLLLSVTRGRPFSGYQGICI